MYFLKVFTICLDNSKFLWMVYTWLFGKLVQSGRRLNEGKCGRFVSTYNSYTFFFRKSDKNRRYFVFCKFANIVITNIENIMELDTRNGKSALI